MTEEQRRLFRETQAVMSLLEGFSDYVMDEVGRDLVPGVERISARFHERRHARRSPFERAIMRLTGMDVKLEQYRKGERFVRMIAEAGGPAALRTAVGGSGVAAAPRGDRRPGDMARPGHAGGVADERAGGLAVSGDDPPSRPRRAG